MGFVDLRRRREERKRVRRKPEGSRRDIARDPLLLVGTGFVLGSSVSHLYFNMLYVSGLSALLPFLAAVALLLYLGWLLGKRPGQTGPKLGSEKQLLMAMLDAGGITPVEAALETSLTVDEAEEILTRLAEHGHLVVESRDGVILYTLPGRPSPGTLYSDSRKSWPWRF